MLRAARHRLVGHSRKAVAEAAGLTPNQLSQFELGRTKLDLYQLIRLCDVLRLDLVKALQAQLRESTPFLHRKAAKTTLISLLANSPSLARIESSEHILSQARRVLEFANTTLKKDEWIAQTYLTLLAPQYSFTSPEEIQAIAQELQKQQNTRAVGFFDKTVRYEAVARLQFDLRLVLAGLLLPSSTPPKRQPRKAVPQLSQLLPSRHYETLSNPELSDPRIEAALDELLKNHTSTAIVLLRALVEYTEATDQNITQLAEDALADLSLDRSPAAVAAVANRLTDLFNRKQLQLVIKNNSDSLRIALGPRDTEAMLWYWLAQFLTLPNWQAKIAKCSDLMCANLLIKNSPRQKWCSQHRRREPRWLAI
jgi:transcriptional regulator with XRE-family HTH domain